MCLRLESSPKLQTWLQNSKKCQQEKHVPKPVAKASNRRWSPPPQDWVKVNVVAATFTETESVWDW